MVKATSMYLQCSDLPSNYLASALRFSAYVFRSGVLTDHLCQSQVASGPEPELRAGFNDDRTQPNLDLRAPDFSGTARDL